MARRFSDPMVDTLDRASGLEQAEEIGGQDGTFPVASAAEPMRQAEPFSELIMARHSDKKRVLAEIKKELKVQAAAWGDKWMWGWEVNDKRRGKVWIEGPTIKMANAISRAFGNCAVDCRVFDLGSRWLIYARFVDLETGYTLVRPYMQRKDTGSIGKMDEQRAFDMAFQNAVSKALRNVIVNSLPDLVEYCTEEAKDAAIVEIKRDPEKVRKWCLAKMATLQIPKERAEHAYTRKAEHWTVPDLARISAEIQSALDGMVPAHELWPAEQDTDEAGTGPVQAQAKQSSPPQQATAKSSSAEPSAAKSESNPKPAGEGGQPPAEKEADKPTETAQQQDSSVPAVVSRTQAKPANKRGVF